MFVGVRLTRSGRLRPRAVGACIPMPVALNYRPMQTGLARFLPIDQLPPELWDGKADVLTLPEVFAGALISEVDSRGLRSVAESHDGSDGPVGGITKAATEAHFARRYATSSGRMQLATLDPKNELADASDHLMIALAGGTVSMLDVPCGAGAGSLALLSTIASLRKHSRLPRNPLHVHLVGGDISPTALEIAQSMLARLKPSLEEQSIFVDAHFQVWDVHNDASNVKIISKWQSHKDSRVYILIAANFSGFLGNKKNLSQAETQLKHLLLWAQDNRSLVLWLEPQTKVASKTLGDIAKSMVAWLETLLPWRPKTASEEPIARSHCRQRHCFRSDVFSVRLALMVLRCVGIP